MASKEYYEGRYKESDITLHEAVKKHMRLDDISVKGGSDTKGDIIGIRANIQIPMSLKNVSGKNTQVHLTTLKKWASVTNMPAELFEKFDKWFGTNDQNLFNQWSQHKILDYNSEIRRKRFKSTNIDEWYKVELWINQINQSGLLPRLLLQSLNGERPVEYLIWNQKKSSKFDVIDVNKLVEWISKECKWETMPSGTVLRCFTPSGKPILWLQMKGSKTEDKIGRDRSPQFHIVDNWLKEFIINEEVSI